MGGFWRCVWPLIHRYRHRPHPSHPRPNRNPLLLRPPSRVKRVKKEAQRKKKNTVIQFQVIQKGKSKKINDSIIVLRLNTVYTIYEKYSGRCLIRNTSSPFAVPIVISIVLKVE